VIGMLSETDLLGASKTRRAALVGGGLSDTDDAPLVFARDVMSRDVVAIEPTADLAAALGLLLKRQIHALPVVEGDRLVGMVSSRDFVREFSYGELPGTCDLVASQLSDAPPEMIAHSATLDDALDVIDQNGVTCLAVMQGDCPIGVTSQRDIIRAKCKLDEQAEYHRECRPAGTIPLATHASPAICNSQRLCEAAAAMIAYDLPAVIVVSPANRLVGLITEDDLLRVLYDALA
jgi:CBS domain-containing protein